MHPICAFLILKSQLREELFQWHRDLLLIIRIRCLCCVQTSLKMYFGLVFFQEVSTSGNQILLRCFSGPNWPYSNSLAGFELLGSAELQLLGGHWKVRFCFCTGFQAGPVPTSPANTETGSRRRFQMVFQRWLWHICGVWCIMQEIPVDTTVGHRGHWPVQD